LLKTSLPLGRVAGIPVRLHWTFALVPLFVSSGSGGTMSWWESLPWIGVVFATVFLHELGHSLVARRFGIKVLDITFWPLGGIARMGAIPESPKVEGLVAIAGPLVNFALAGLSAVVLALAIGGDALADPGDLDVWRRALADDVVALLAAEYLLLNLIQGCFNLLPAFPMDGGRILRALLGLRHDWLGATERAVRVGRWVAFLMAAVAVYERWWMLLVVALFIWIQGGLELFAVRMRRVAAAAAGGFGVGFGGPGGPGGFGSFGVPPRMADAGARSWEPPSAAPFAGGSGGSSGAGGFSDADVARLESYRGPLRPRRDAAIGDGGPDGGGGTDA
jgi:Zn-dependent protease